MTKELALSLIEEISEVTPLAMEDSIEACAADSLDFIFLTQGIEKRIGVTIPNEELVKFETVGQMVEWIACN